MSVIIDTTVLNHEANEDLFKDFDLNTRMSTNGQQFLNITIETRDGAEYIMGFGDTKDESEAMAKINLILKHNLIDLTQKIVNTNYKTIYLTHGEKTVIVECNTYTQLLAEILKQRTETLCL